MRYLTPEEAIAKKQMKQKMIIAGSIITVGVLSGLLTYIANSSF